MKSEGTRPYRQTARAEAAARTHEAILRAAVDAWRERDWEAVTVAEIAERAGVTVQTVLRRFGSKDGIVDACIRERASGVESVRDRATPGAIPSVLDALLDHYEQDGDAVLRTLSIEGRVPAAARITSHGRAVHRAWCARMFAPFLPSDRAKAYTPRLDAFVAATDIYIWKLLRRDLRRSRAQTHQAITALVEGLACTTTEGRAR